jgi:hypothetical protein
LEFGENIDGGHMLNEKYFNDLMWRNFRKIYQGGISTRYSMAGPPADGKNGAFCTPVVSQ